MAFFSFQHVKIAGISGAVPKNRKCTRNLKCFANLEEAERVVAMSCVEETRIVSKGQTASDLCFAAAENLLSNLNWDKQDIELLVYVTFSRDYITVPNTSNVLQSRLGLPVECMAIDLPQACPGYIYGLNVVASLLQAGCVKKALLLVGETNSMAHSSMDKTIYPLIGDAGTATALEYDETANPMQIHVAADGGEAEYLIAPDGGARNPATVDSLKVVEEEPGIFRNKLHIRMDGMEVFRFSINAPVSSVVSLCQKYDICLSDVDYLVLHQANKYIDEKIAHKLKIPLEKVPFSLAKYGNPSGCSIPLTIVNNLRDKVSKSKVELLLCGFGAGLSWGSAHIVVDHIICPAIIDV